MVVVQNLRTTTTATAGARPTPLTPVGLQWSTASRTPASFKKLRVPASVLLRLKAQILKVQ